MPRFVISDRRKCPELDAESIDLRSIRKWEHDDSIEMIICSREVAREVLSHSFPNLKVIQLFSAGFDGIDPSQLQERGIHLCNAANVYNTGMAEFVVYAILMSAKRYNKHIKRRHIRLFRHYRFISELAGKTVGILGAGNIGTQIAKRLLSFEMTVLGYDINTHDRPYFSKIYDVASLGEFLPKCDYIVNCMPLFESTKGMLNKKWFELMKKDVTIVNVGRKQIINDKDFIHFLSINKDATAILDMFEKIPNPITNPYRRLSNVLVLPGVTAISREINKKLSDLIIENVNRFQRGEELLNQII